MRGGVLRQAVAWIGVLCIYVQLAAVGLCAAGTPADAGPIPICHAQPSAGHTDDRGPPTHDHQCPFCAAHCHAAMASAPTPGHVARGEVASRVIGRPAFSIRTVPRLVAGASPRGPPVAA